MLALRARSGLCTLAGWWRRPRRHTAHIGAGARLTVRWAVAGTAASVLGVALAVAPCGPSPAGAVAATPPYRDASPLPVPFVSQWQGLDSDDSTDCGPASLAMAIWYFYQGVPTGVDGGPTVRNLVQEIRTDTGVEGNTTAEALKAVVDTNSNFGGLTASTLDHATFKTAADAMSQMENALDPINGDLVLALLNGSDPALGRDYSGHWVVVTGFSSDDSTVYVNDPDFPYHGTGLPGGVVAFSSGDFLAALGSAVGLDQAWGVVLGPTVSAEDVYGIGKPADLRTRLPWAPGVPHSITLGYGQNSDVGPQGYDALTFDVRAGEAVYPIASGTLVFAGQATGQWASLGTIVVIDHQASGSHYQSLYAHLGSVDPSLQGYLNMDPGLSVNLDANQAIGTAGSGGLRVALYQTAANPKEAGSFCYPGQSCADVYSGSVDQTSVVANGVGPIDGAPVLPEPLVGQDVYENFAWFSGPMTAASQAAAGSAGPGGTWTSNTTLGDLGISSGPIVYETHVTSPVPLAKVQFTAWYVGWANTTGTAFANPAFPDGQIWRIVCSIGPQPTSAPLPSSSDCPTGTWSGSSTDAVVRFQWDPWADPNSNFPAWVGCLSRTRRTQGLPNALSASASMCTTQVVHLAWRPTGLSVS